MPTRLIAVRHAKPEPAADYPDDALRPLSEEGSQVQRAVAAYLHDLGVRVDMAYTSPLLRALQTAEILVEALGGDLHTEESLGPSFDDERMLQRIVPGKTTLFVGHDPTLAAFLNRCVGTLSFPGLVKSGAVLITFDEVPLFGKGEVERIVRPEDAI
ncbi:MAG: histidine phosphatase family protein [Parachlamydiales bacterium]